MYRPAREGRELSALCIASAQHSDYMEGAALQVLVGWRVARSCAGFFPVRAAFPGIGAGRRPHRYFRGLLKLHTRYGSR